MHTELRDYYGQGDLAFHGVESTEQGFRCWLRCGHGQLIPALKTYFPLWCTKDENGTDSLRRCHADSMNSAHVEHVKQCLEYIFLIRFFNELGLQTYIKIFLITLQQPIKKKSSDCWDKNISVD